METQNPFSLGVEQIIKQPIPCADCGRTHSAGIDEIVVAAGARKLLYKLLAPYSSGRIFVVGDGASMALLGDEVAERLGFVGYKVSKFSFGGAPLCDHAHAGQLLLELPGDAALVLGVGGGTICGLVKYLAARVSLPCVILPTAASTDSYAMPFASFIEKDAKKTLPAATPKMIIADTEILQLAPRELTTAGFGAASAKTISALDWYLSSFVNGSYYCAGVSRWLLEQVREVCTCVKNGMAMSSAGAIETLMRCLLASGVACQLAGSPHVVRGSESAMADHLEQQFLREGERPNYSMLQGLAGAYCTRMVSMLQSNPVDFESARELLDNFGWVAYNNEVARVFGERAGDVLAREDGAGLFNYERHQRRIDALEANWPALLRAMRETVPPYTEMRALYQSSGFAYHFESYGIDREDALDAVIWSLLFCERYGLLSLLWDTAQIDAYARKLTQKMQ